MEEIYRILCICLGEPPKTFDLEVTDKDDKFIRDTNLTGTAFFEKYVGLNLDDYVSLINAPTADKPYHRSYSVKFLGNVKEGCPVRYLRTVLLYGLAVMSVRILPAMRDFLILIHIRLTSFLVLHLA